MAFPKIRAVRAFVVRGGGADYHDQGGGHWIDDHIATPMSRYPEYRQSRQSFGINVLGTLVVEIEAENGAIGFAVTTGGEPACFIVEKHLARFLEGRDPAEVEKIWDQMYFSTQYYGRKGLVINAISGVDLALWDLLGKLRDEPVHQLLGGAVRDELVFYATGARPDLAKEMGFIGGKMPLHHGPAEGEEGLNKALAEIATMRERVGKDFWLMLDCWMALDLNYATRLATRAWNESGLKWIEEALSPDDYWGYRDLKKAVPPGMLVTTGEHDATRWGFRMLLEMDCCDIIQPDVGWCGGVTELIKIANLADAHGKLMVPHGSSVYSYHFVITRHNSPFAEFLMMAPKADKVVPMFAPQLLGEPVPEGGRIKASALDKPGFGVELNREVKLHRPYPPVSGGAMLPFVDAHVHLWDLDHIRYPWLTPPFADGPAGTTEAIAVNYELDDYLADVAGWDVHGIVHVDAGAHPADALKETQWLQAMAGRRGMPNAIIAFAALNDPDLDSLLTRHAAHPNVRGIRHIAGWHPDPRRSYAKRDVTGDAEWQAGFALLKKYDLSFDCQLYASQFAGFAALVARHPEIPVILNHLGMPILSDADGEDVWREGLKKLAALPNLHIKLSGVGFIHRRWTVENIRPFMLTAIDLFGPQRCLVASDFPADKLFDSFDAHMTAYREILAVFSEAEQRAMFAGNAVRVYRLGVSL